MTVTDACKSTDYRAVVSTGSRQTVTSQVTLFFVAMYYGSTAGRFELLPFSAIPIIRAHECPIKSHAEWEENLVEPRRSTEIGDSSPGEKGSLSRELEHISQPFPIPGSIHNPN